MSKLIDWTPARIETLSALWAEGHTTNEISRRMGLPKNAVVGKAHRLELPARPSPIGRTGPQRPAVAKPLRAGAGTLPPLVAVPPVLMPPAAPPAVPVRVSAPMPVRATEPCCWITSIGRPWTRCGKPAVVGKPYCQEHCRVAYVPAVARRQPSPEL